MKIQTWGNSAAVRLPAILLHKLNMQVGQEIDATIVDGALVLKPAKQKYKLSALVAMCDQQTRRDVDEAWQNGMEPAGSEVW